MSPVPELAYVQLFARAEDMPYAWRLLGGNNRETGRSAGTFPDVPAARAAVAQFQRELDSYHSRLDRLEHNQFTWLLLRGDTPVAASGRSYDRQVRCEQALSSFLRAIRTAPISDTVVLSSTRRWQSRSASAAVAEAAHKLGSGPR